MIIRRLGLISRRPTSKTNGRNRYFCRTPHSRNVHLMKENISPITVREFRIMFEACKPQSLKVWPNKIALAFSGGPDSTALLFLLACLAKENKQYLKGPQELLSISVDHGLQASSSEMALRCSEIAKALSVQHISVKVPWGTDPFPQLPPSHKLESIAREVRYHLLFQVLKEHGIPVIAFGHHVDDQVETALLRIAHGSTAIGAAGMRRVRKWGMGFSRGPDMLGWAGHLGMKKWIIRPLLSESKDRLVSTCDYNDLSYVQDQTNFQPALTERNRIRHELSKDIHIGPPSLEESDRRRDLSTLLKMAAGSFGSRSIMRYSPTIEDLRTAVTVLSRSLDRLDAEVTAHLHRRSSFRFPVSTFLLSLPQIEAIHDNIIRKRMVSRIIRYVSPLPWGSLGAEASHSVSSLQRIVDRLWRVEPSEPCRPFTAGAYVLWSPVTVNAKGVVKLSPPDKSSDRVAWLASRQPPPKSADGLDPLVQDITEDVTAALQNPDGHSLEFMFDNRFLLTVKPHVLPANIVEDLLGNRRLGMRDEPSPLNYQSSTTTDQSSQCRILLVPHSAYFLPSLKWRPSSGKHPDVPIASLSRSGVMSSPIFKNNKDPSFQFNISIITARFVRSLGTD